MLDQNVKSPLHKYIEVLKLVTKPKVYMMRVKDTQIILDLIQSGFLEWQDGWVKITDKGQEFIKANEN